MKPPLTVEARVAEELRNWLASELEQLDASNTNQFAHHVVTILLHEDLDIEDEPLTAGDDFLQNIYSIKRGKTRDRQKKAAVQFLRSAVCCNDSDESEIQGVVDELMVKIDETKSKMNKKSSKRSLLAPIAINVKTATAQTCNKCDGSEEERRYNEAFPSLASEESPSKEGATLLTVNSVWYKSLPSGKENGKKKMKRKPHYLNRQFYMFTCQEEAEACNIARQVAALALAETSLPNAEAAEVSPSTSQDSSPSSFADSSGCWKSAFRTVVFTKVFSPTVAPLDLKEKILDTCANKVVKVFTPNIVREDNLNSLDLNQAASYGYFHPVYDERNQHLFPKVLGYEADNSVDSKNADIEISLIFEASKRREEQLRRRVQKIKKTKKGCTAYSEDELENALQFPYHCGDFWREMVHRGAVILYPDLHSKETCVNSDTQEGTILATTGDREVGELSLLCLKALRQNFTPETTQGLVLHYISVSYSNNYKWNSGQILKGMVDTLLKRKEKTLVLSRFNINDKKIQESLEVDKVLEACIEMLTSLLSPMIPEAKWSNETLYLSHPVKTESPAYGIHDNDYSPEDIDFFTSYVTENDETNNIIGTLITSSEDEADGNVLVTASTNDLTKSTLDSTDLDSISVTDLVCFNTVSAAPVTNTLSPNFLGNIDLTYLDDIDNRSSEGESQLRETVLTSTEIHVLNDNSLSGEFVETTNDIKEQNLCHVTQLTEWRISAGCFLSPLQPVQTSGLEMYEQHDIGYFSSDSKQAQWNNPWSMTEWDIICRDWLSGLREGCIPWPNHGSPPNPFMPSLLTSCLSERGAQLLQSAFVNSYFSSNLTEPLVTLQENAMGVDCSALEQLWLSKYRKNSSLEHLWSAKDSMQSIPVGLKSSREVIKGWTCSNWLENNCKLGPSCPFSHPRLSFVWLLYAQGRQCPECHVCVFVCPRKALPRMLSMSVCVHKEGRAQNVKCVCFVHKDGIAQNVKCVCCVHKEGIVQNVKCVCCVHKEGIVQNVKCVCFVHKEGIAQNVKWD
ncbi:hypothetical protein Btru_017196 [Bulinus truncatus]|nr:hypothetical protein Btru_017196 [Bulinus truncatus]